MCDAVTNCTDNCTQCLKEAEAEKEENNEVFDHYKMTLYIYHIDEEDRDALTGESFMVRTYGINIDEMKKSIPQTLILTMRMSNLKDGLTLVECDIEKNGEYFDSDTGYYRVDLANGTAKFLID
jgi:hypothetical protein